MTIELQQFGITIAVGLYTLFAIVIVASFIFRIPPYKLFKKWIKVLIEDKGKATNFTHFVLFVTIGIAALSLGIVTENLSDDFTDQFPMSHIFGKEEEMRAEALFKGDGSPTSLAYQLQMKGVLNTFGYNKFRDQNDLANDIYHIAKGIVYRHDNYFQELRDIEIRIDFTRSFYFVSFYLLLACFVYVLLYWDDSIGEIEYKGQNLHNKKSGNTEPYVVYIFTFLLLTWISYIAYADEEERFNSRVYRYFATLVSTDDELFKKTPPMKSPSISGLTTLITKSEYGDEKEYRYAVVNSKDSSKNRVFRLEQHHGTIYVKPLTIRWGRWGKNYKPADLYGKWDKNYKPADLYGMWGKNYKPADLYGICSDEASIWVLGRSNFGNYNRQLFELKQTKDLTWKASKHINFPNKFTYFDRLECKRDSNNNWLFLVSEYDKVTKTTTLYRYRLDGNRISKVGISCSKQNPWPLEVPLESKHRVSGLEIINNSLIVSSARDGRVGNQFESVIFSMGCIKDDMSIQGENKSCILQKKELSDLKVAGITEGWESGTLLVGADNKDNGELEIVSIGNLQLQCSD